MSHLERFKDLLLQMKNYFYTELPPEGKRVLDLNRLRTFLLVLLLVYTSISVTLLVSRHPSNTVIRSETREFFGYRKTHNSSNEELEDQEENSNSSDASSACSSLVDGTSSESSQEGTLCCDRSHFRTDVCYLKGDIRTDPWSSSIILYNAGESSSTKEELIKPYTRKWETSIMNVIHELRLRPVKKAGDGDARRCDIKHDAPAIVFSNGGYTGNVYHEFNDGLIPIYITGERFEREVVLVAVDFHEWWLRRYEGMVKGLTRHEVVNFEKDKRVHCFKEMIVGLKIHGDMIINSTKGKGMRGFQALLSEWFKGESTTEEEKLLSATRQKPRIVIVTREISRVLTNLQEMVKACKKTGFDVQLLNPRRNMQLSDIYNMLSTTDVMIGVHGAAMTHFLFMRPGSTFIQIVPLGLIWAADAYYGGPAKKLGLEYMEYRISAEESSLSKKYDANDPVIVDPDSVNKKGWSETKRIYLENQNVTVNTKKFQVLLEKAYSRIKSH